MRVDRLMPAQQISVKVLDGETVVEPDLRRPIRLTPRGFAGVAFAGAVYELRPNNVIDIAGASWEIGDCERFLLGGTDIPIAPTRDRPALPWKGFADNWLVDTNSFGHHVLFNATEAVAGTVIDALVAGGMPVQRWDVSHRAASDGRFYDWFARLRFIGTHDECVTRVTAIFTEPVTPEPTYVEPRVDPAETLVARVEELLDRLTDLAERFESSERRAQHLRASLEASMARESRLIDDLDRSHEHQRSLRGELDELSRDPQQSIDASSITRRLSESEEFIEIALAENAELIRTNADLEAAAERSAIAITTLESTTRDLQARLEEAENQEHERRQSVAARLGPKKGVSGFLDSAFSRLTFVPDSVEAIANLEPSRVRDRLQELTSAGRRGGC